MGISFKLILKLHYFLSVTLAFNGAYPSLQFAELGNMLHTRAMRACIRTTFRCSIICSGPLSVRTNGLVIRDSFN